MHVQVLKLKLYMQVRERVGKSMHVHMAWCFYVYWVMLYSRQSTLGDDFTYHNIIMLCACSICNPKVPRECVGGMNII